MTNNQLSGCASDENCQEIICDTYNMKECCTNIWNQECVNVAYNICYPPTLTPTPTMENESGSAPQIFLLVNLIYIMQKKN